MYLNYRDTPGPSECNEPRSVLSVRQSCNGNQQHGFIPSVIVRVGDRKEIVVLTHMANMSRTWAEEEV